MCIPRRCRALAITFLSASVGQHLSAATVFALVLSVPYPALAQDGGRIPVMDIVDHPPPIASLITVGTPAPDGTTTLSGAPGAVPPGVRVLVASLAYAIPRFVFANQDGSFEVGVPSAPGDTIQIRYLVELGNSYEPQDLASTVHWPGTLVRVPQSEPASDFAGAYYSNVAGGIVIGFASGTVSETRLAVGGTIRVTGTVAFYIPAGAVVPSVESIGGELVVSPLFDAAGNQVGAGTDFISHLLTPTGLPIERSILGGQGLGPLQVTDLERVGDLLSGSFDASAAIPAGLPDGTYLLFVGFGLPPELGVLGVPDQDAGTAITQPTGGAVAAAIVTVGDPAPPRLALMLLTDSPSQGQRGTVAREDAPHIAFANHIATAGRFVIPPRELGSGDLIAYRLEPFLPLVSLGDRLLPQEPAIPFDLPGGSLTVTIFAPDGRRKVLGPHTIQQARTGQASSSRGVLLDEGGPTPGSVYQLTTLSDDFAYRFRQYGRYEIRLSGTVPDIWGTSYSLDSVFDVWVAETLDLEASSLPSTPFEVGDSLPASLTVFPGVPAAIEWEVTVHPIDGSDPVTRMISGTANRYGYFAVADAFSFDVAGEYLSTIHASYTDAEGRLWMATRTWGSGIATPDGPLIAHGRRGIDSAPIEERDAWFTRSSTGIPSPGPSHISSPYHSGDILWQTEEDSAQSRITVQDTDGEIEALIMDRIDQINIEDDPAQRVALAELPLGISTSTGFDPTLNLARIDQWSYAYRAVERPGIRVRETIGTDQSASAYWRFQELYLMQQGMGAVGELPNDLKWQFGAAVFKRHDLGIGEVAIYASLWVEIPDSDPDGTRVFPPFQGAGGGPSGGPILTLQGEAFDLFILPTTIHPGAVLELGDRFIFAGQVGPPLASKVTYSVTSPSGATFGGTGTANAIGYYADPGGGFAVDEPGIWTVQVDVLHDGNTSAGAVAPPFPTGGVLGSEEGSYRFFVVGPAAPTLNAGLDYFNIADLGEGDGEVDPIHFFLEVPEGWTDVEADFVIRMPGFILATGQASPANGTIEVVYDPVRLNSDFPNIDLSRRQDGQPGLADEVIVTVYLSGRDGSGTPTQAAKMLTLVGEDIYDMSDDHGAAVFNINAGHAGAWFNTATAGQGQLIDVEPDSQFMFISWFTYTDAASANPFEQRWLTAQGNYSGNTAELPLFETLGGKFDDPQEVTTNQVGEVTLSFSDCEQGQMTYSLDEEGLQGAFPLLRVIPGSGNVCEERNGNNTQAVDINAGMDGAWFDPDTPGQGFFIDAHPDPEGGNFIFVSWFTYGEDTASGQRWLTAQGSFAGSIAEIDVFETTGGSFDDPQATSTTNVGTMSLDFTDCSNALLTYALTDSDAEGDIAITRVIPGGQALCEELAGAD